MTREEIMTLGFDELEARKAAIVTETDEADAEKLDALNAELEAIEERTKALNLEIEESRKAAEAVANGAGKEIETRKDEKKMTDMEIRNSHDYIEAFAQYVKTGDAKECRSLLTENVSGTVAVPEFVYDIVKTAWEREGIMSLVRKSYLRGNLKVQFEISGGEATVHTEGAAAVSEEALVLGIVTLVPQSIKKWIAISDEVYDLRGEEFLRYIYDELTYRIAKKAADTLIGKIEACGTVSTTTCPGVPKLTAASPALGTVAAAMAMLSDEAANPVVIMNKATWGAFKAVEYAGSFPADPFEGLPVIFNNTIKSSAAATTGETYAIVGDLGHGALANFPNGEGIDFKFDELSKKKEDLIEVLGREYVGLGVVAANAFVKITK